MIKIAQDKFFKPRSTEEDRGESVTAMVELTEEETGLVGGGPEVENNPGNT